MRAETDAVTWHDVENGSYEADLPLWRELSQAAGGPILEIGCGTGRVALDLARHGQSVMGVDIEPCFVEAFRERAASRGLQARAEVGDARALQIAGDFALVLAPMQVIQLLPGAEERKAALRGIRDALGPRGIAALAIVEEDLGSVDPVRELGGVLPDVCDREGWIYSSLPTELCEDAGRLVVSRLRQIVAPDGDLTEERHTLSLAILDAASLEDEAAAVGLRPAGRRDVPATDAHVGSTVLLLEVAP